MARKEITLDKVEGNMFELYMDGCNYILSRAELENLIKNLECKQFKNFSQKSH